MENSNLPDGSSKLELESVCYADSIENSLTTNAQEDKSIADHFSIPTDEDQNSEAEFSINTSIPDTEELDLNELRKKLEQAEEREKLLQFKNEKITLSLDAEKTRTSKLEKKLQFVKDNEEVFMRLKEAYINMKYNEAAGRKMIEIREKGIQTWQGILCRTCTETEEVRRQVAILTNKYKEFFVLPPGEMEQLINTMKYLKDLVERRERSWSFNIERENKLQHNVNVLERENSALRELLQNKNENPDEALIKQERMLAQEKKIMEQEQLIEAVTKNLDGVKKIIVKYEECLRKHDKNRFQTIVHPLTDNEKKLVNQIITKYRTKEPKNGKDRSRSHSVEIAHPSKRTTSPFKPFRISTSVNSCRPDSAAIMLIDNLFNVDFEP